MTHGATLTLITLFHAKMIGSHTADATLIMYSHPEHGREHDMASDEYSSTFLATQTRQGSLKRFGKALANLYRDNKKIELNDGNQAVSRREWVRSGEFRLPKFRRVTRFASTDDSGVKLELQTKSREVPTAEAVKNMQDIDRERRLQTRGYREIKSRNVDFSVSRLDRRQEEKALSSATKLSQTTDMEVTRFVLSKKENLGRDERGDPIRSKRTSGALSYGRDRITLKLATGGLDDHAVAATAISHAASDITWRDSVASEIAKLNERNHTSKLDERSRDRGGRGR